MGLWLKKNNIVNAMQWHGNDIKGEMERWLGGDPLRIDYDNSLLLGNGTVCVPGGMVIKREDGSLYCCGPGEFLSEHVLLSLTDTDASNVVLFTPEIITETDSSVTNYSINCYSGQILYSTFLNEMSTVDIFVDAVEDVPKDASVKHVAQLAIRQLNNVISDLTKLL